MTDSSSSPLVPFLSVLLGGGESNNSNNSFRRTLSTTATVGLSFVLLRFVVSAYKAAAEDNDDDGNDDQKGREINEFLRNVLQRMILQTGRGKLDGSENDTDDSSEEENVPMIHQGSCHCRAVRFELIAPTRIICKEAQNGKIQYRHARIRAKSFRFVSGAGLVQMYYVNKSPTNSTAKEEVGAHSFCSRCGVHILFAPNSHSTALDVNVDCLNQKDVKIKSAKGNKRVNLSVGIPVSDQWENEAEMNPHRYPATIAEEHTPMGVMPFDKTSPFAAYKHHPLMRHHNRQLDWDHLDYVDNDDNTIDLVFPEGDKMEPDTPSTTHTVYTTQTEPLSSTGPGGVPPTLTLDTRAYTDSESVVSLSSTRSGVPLTSSSSLRTNASASLHQDSFGAMPSPPSNSGISPSTTPLVRHQMNFYMRKHMSSGSSITTSSPSPRVSPANTTNTGMPPLYPTTTTSSRQDLN